MDAKFVARSRSPTLTSAHWKLKRKAKQPCVVGVLTRPADDITGETKNTVYKDNWFDHLAINHLSRSLQAATGSFPFYSSIVIHFK